MTHSPEFFPGERFWKNMSFLSKAILCFTALLLLYGISYLASTHRFVSYSGSAPIYDPNWSITIQLDPTYRFFSPEFWIPAHSIDRKLRPDYWEHTVRADKPPSEGVVTENIFIELPHRSWLNWIFPTVMDVQ